MTDGNKHIEKFKESTAKALEYASTLGLAEKKEFLLELDKSLIELADFADKLQLDITGENNDG